MGRYKDIDVLFRRISVILRMLAFSCAGIFIFNGKLISQTSWNYIHPMPTGNRLNSISFYDCINGFSAGSNGTIIRTTDGGNSWYLENTGVSLSINRIFCISKNNTAAIGDKGLILTKSNDKDFWIRRRCPVQLNLHDITFISDKTGYASGLGGTVLKTTSGGTYWAKLNTGTSASLFCINFADNVNGVSGGFDIIIKTTDGGATWTNLNVSINPPSQISDIKMFGRDTIYALCSTPYGEFYKSTDGGNTWTIHRLNLRLLYEGSVDLVRSFSFKNSMTGYIVTDLGTILKTDNGGVNWSSDSSYRPAYEKTGIFSEVYRFDSGRVFIAGGGGTILKNAGDLNGWKSLSGNHADIRSIFFQNEITGFAASTEGKIFKTTDSGISWENIETGYNEVYNHITFISDKTGFVSGSNGKILKSYDSGKNWKSMNTGIEEDLHCISFTDTATGFACGGKSEAVILKTSDAGESWRKIYTNTEILRLNSIEFANESTGFAGGKFGNLLRTTDGGNSWMLNKISPEDILSISFYDISNGLLAGEDGFIFRTTDGGNNWIYTESGYYNTLFSIAYVTRDFAICSGREGRIIYSTNKGAVWNKAERITDNSLYGISVTGFNDDKMTAFAAGKFGTVLRSVITIPRIITNADTEIHEEIISYPNPFKDNIKFKYELKDRGEVMLKIYDISGREIHTLVNCEQNSGKQEVNFELRKELRGASISSGIYFYTFYLNGKIKASGRLLHLK
ncbi:MAG: Ycf48-like protein [Ignavibacteria bacterium]|nr:Ycf48-like protein [Ignavibacteria bacterium]